MCVESRDSGPDPATIARGQMPLTKLLRRYVTPRKIAWLLVLSGIAWFIYVSPKTPLAFFDAATRDSEELEKREMKKYESIDAEAAAKARVLNEMMSYGRQMDRLALTYDLSNDPTRVQQQKDWIVDGGYSADEQTDKTLRANDEQYRELAKAVAKCRTEYRSNETLISRLQHMHDTAAKDKRFQEALMEMAMDRHLFRAFQARLFWWGGR